MQIYMHTWIHGNCVFCMAWREGYQLAQQGVTRIASSMNELDLGQQHNDNQQRNGDNGTTTIGEEEKNAYAESDSKEKNEQRTRKPRITCKTLKHYKKNTEEIV